jgi:WXG100 family type VII secretion target
MADSTQATSAQMRATRTQVMNMDQETDGELSRLRSAAMSLRSDNWKSTVSGKSFDDTMAEWDRDAGAMRQALQEIAVLLKTTADGYDRTEEDHVNAVRIMSGDGTSYDLGR